MSRQALAAAATCSVVALCPSPVAAASPGVAGPVAAGPAAAPVVVDRQTVQVSLTPTGTLRDAKLFRQLTVLGNGRLSLTEGSPSQGVRNLDGFAAPRIVGGQALYTLDVRGRAVRRTVADFGRPLPVSVEASYRLDGRAVQPADVVGRSGVLDVRYTVRNVTATPTQVVYRDAAGAAHSEQVDLVTPYVGQLTTTLPTGYEHITAPRADVAGDGRGGSLLTYTMVLFSPIGDPVQNFGYQARVRDAQLPAAKVQIVPVDPAGKPELAFGENGFRDGASQAAALTVGAGTIDRNLLALQAGSSQLLGGLTQLAAGAVSLQNGLDGRAAPGARALAAGAATAQAGGSALADGLAALHKGAIRLAGGLDKAAAGGSALSAGATRLSTGAGQAATGAGALSDGIQAILTGVQGLPATVSGQAGFQQLKAALAGIATGIGSPADTAPTSLLGGLNLLGAGLRSPLGVAGCDQSASPGTAIACGAADGVQLVAQQLAAAAAAGGGIDQILGAARAAYAGAACPVAPVGSSPVPGVVPPTKLPAGICQAVAGVAFGLGLPAGVRSATDPGGLKAQTALAAGALGRVFAGIDAGIIPGLARVRAGLSNPACSASAPTASANPCGVKEVAGLVSGGLDALVAGVSSQLSTFLSQAAAGARSLAAGTRDLAAGAQALQTTGAVPLAAGLTALSAGGGTLAAGAGQAATGATALSTGLGALDAGAAQLSSGLDTAAVGSRRLATGLATARDGAAKVTDGTGRLHREGTAPLVVAGAATQHENALRYATLVALGEKGRDGALPYAPPSGATGSAAYSFTLAAATSAGRDDATRAGLGLGLLCLVALGAGALRRRAVSW